MKPQAQRMSKHKKENTGNEWLQYLLDGEVRGVRAVRVRPQPLIEVSAAQRKAVRNGE
jgi:hypothetical protein